MGVGSRHQEARNRLVRGRAWEQRGPGRVSEAEASRVVLGAPGVGVEGVAGVTVTARGPGMYQSICFCPLALA